MISQRSGFRSIWERRIGRTESPIEALFVEAFCPAAIEHGYAITTASRAKHSAIAIKTQQWVDKYRVDFLIRYRFYTETFEAVVECDGHEFHERTRRQAARDRSRDRAIQQAGFRIFRFTGSEIFGSPRSCAAEVLDAIMDFQTAAFVRAIEHQQLEAA